MNRVIANIVSLLIFIGVIIGATLALRGLGVNHMIAWLIGIFVGAVVMAFLEISGLYARSWR